MASQASPAAWQHFEAALSKALGQMRDQGQITIGGQADESGSYADAVVAVCSSGSGAALRLLNHVLERITRNMKHEMLADFNVHLTCCSALDDGDFAAALPAALKNVVTRVNRCRLLVVGTARLMLENTRSLESWEHANLITADAKVQHAVAATVLLVAGKQLPGLLHRFFSLSLAAMGEEMAGDAPPALAEVTSHMTSLEMRGMLEQTAAAAVHAHIKAHIAASTAHVFNESALAPSLEYASTLPLHFLELVLPLESAESRAALLQGWRQYLRALVYKSVGGLRIEEMFDIVVDYPDSRPALEDLHECMRHASLHRRLVTRFGQAIRARLLHAGAATTDIIQQYVSTIRALQHVDPSGAVLDAVSGPIRGYLRCRKDTTRCIVTLLTNNDSADGTAASLFAELDAAGTADGRTGDAEGDFEGADADAQALAEAERWEPDPIEADPALRTGASSDAISLLVGIYGTKELFVSEYRCMLADRLLAKADFECDRELRTLELLKVRFGEASLHAAEVMLRDMAESKRVNANVKSVPNTATPLKRRHDLVPIDALSATIVSQLFWPPLPQEDIKLPAQISSMLGTYAHKYNSLKAPRILEWKPSLGVVTLDLTIGDRTVEFTVSPFHATVLLHFQAQAEWTQAELAAELGAPPDALRRKVVYWVNQGVLSERRGTGDVAVVYVRNEQLQSCGGAADGEVGMEVEEGSIGQAEAQEMAKLEPFVLGMLTNFDSLPLDRIHNMLKMFATDPPYDKTLEQLGAYMSHLITDDKVVVEGGLYKKRT